MDSKKTYLPIFKDIGISSVLCWLSCLAMAVAIYMVFLYAPTEETMGVVQRIFYFHVSSAWIAFLAFFLVMAASIAYLMTGNVRWDIWAYASAEIGTLFCTLVLLTGPLWAKPVWNTWWTWDMRLTTTLILWLMYLGYLMLRANLEGERSAKYAAVFGIIAFLDVPFVYFSIRWWRTLHPAPVIAGKAGSGLAPEMLIALLVSLFTFMCLFVYLLQHRVMVAWMERDLNQIRQTVVEQSTQYGVLIENQDFIIEEYDFQEYKRS
ncbi:ABC-type transport system involved in cytochrome c biogenesis, permease component [Candidatus Vecturithrix granuli]|uniref:Heme exporter protein C n=1 Tax=Vecturithrix granuli TaxID=1499967 RepID=A0A081BUP5_VECG1|nr:ABC-type transport system involved in cytochrome c biogenesis, permease component [Candidatus Vecturithrix granuli]